MTVDPRLWDAVNPIGIELEVKLKIIFITELFFVLKKKKATVVKCYNVPQLNVIYPNGLFYSTSDPKPPNIQFTFTYDVDKYHIFTFEKWYPENFLKNDHSKTVVCCGSASQWIH